MAKLAEHVKLEIAELRRLKTDEVNCPICMASLYEGVDFNDANSVAVAIALQDGGSPAIDHVIKMVHCKSHFYHLTCLS